MNLLKKSLIVFGAAAVAAVSLVSTATTFAAPNNNNQNNPPGNNGTVKIHEASNHDDNLPNKENDPKVCTFHIHGFNFDNGQTNTWVIDQQQPTGNQNNITNGNYTADTNGEWSSSVISIPSGHYKLSVEGVQGSGKFKVFWVECDAPTPTPTPIVYDTPTPTPTPTIPVGGDEPECVVTDVNGYLEYTGNHMSSNPVNGYFKNIAIDETCEDEVYFHVYGSNIYPESDGWLESQTHLFTQGFVIPQNETNFHIEFPIQDDQYCWYQVDVTRVPNAKNPPTYFGTEMIDYVFVKGTKDCGESRPTPTPTCSANCDVVTPTPTPTTGSTPTPTPSNTGGSVQSASAENKSTLGATTLANTGGMSGLLANLGIVMGISLISASLFRKSK